MATTAYRRYLICDSSDGRIYIERDKTLIGWAVDMRDAKAKIDAIAGPEADDRKPIEMGLGGWTNPYSDKPCGAADFTAKHPEPVHIGGCKTCRAAIVEMLRARVPASAKPGPVDQMGFDW
jgi:hypothetical protein